MNRRYLTYFVVACLSLSSAKAQEAKPLTAEAKKAAVERIGTLLIEKYVFEDVAKQCAAHIGKRLVDGAFNSLNDVPQFAEALTKELQSISHDKHMRVRPAPTRSTRDQAPNPFLDNFLDQQSMARRNFGVARAEILDGNIGLLDIRGFPPTEVSRATVAAALKVLENVDALIVDVRKNGGGNPDLIRYYCSHFFPPKTHLNSLYWRQGNRTEEFWTLESVEGKRRSDLPVFILTSSRTFSGGEEFAYNFKTRKRATLIGETTGGGANPGGMFPVNEALAIFVPTGRAINPVTKTNWEGVGVEPDIATKADDALETALPLAREAAEKYSKAQAANIEMKVEPLNKALGKGESLASSGKSDEAQKVVSEALEAGLASGVATETSINTLGYNYLGAAKIEMALAVFAFNVKQFPQSSNVYDSMGEALMKAGRIDESIRNYRKSVELDPGNENAKALIRKMEKEKKEGKM
jgi:hypothetical protein